MRICFDSSPIRVAVFTNRRSFSFKLLEFQATCTSCEHRVHDIARTVAKNRAERNEMGHNTGRR